MLVNAAVQYVLPASSIAASPRAAIRRHGHSVGSLGRGNRFGGHGAIHAGGNEWNGDERRARCLFAVARDGYFSRRAGGSASPVSLRPLSPLSVQAILAIILLLFGGISGSSFRWAIFAEWLFDMIAGSTIFVFRSRDPEAVRPLSGSGDTRLFRRCSFWHPLYCSTTRLPATCVYRALAASRSSPAYRFSMYLARAARAKSA